MARGANSQGGAGEAVDDAPFPLRRYFYGLVLPGLLLMMAAVVFATTQTVRSSTIEVLLQIATERAAGVAQGVREKAGDAWERLIADQGLNEADMAELAEAFADEQAEAQIVRLKIYDRAHHTIFATDHSLIGHLEDKPELVEALAGEPSVLVENDEGGSAFYELYLPYRVDGTVVAVFEIYQPIDGVDALLWKVVRPALVIPLVLFAVMLAGLSWIVGRAQRDIDRRTGLIVALRQRLERLVSHQAVAAMQGESAAEGARLDVTLLYSDVRGFTALAERSEPEETIAFLNAIIGLQVAIIEAAGGDIDKMIGDAVLAHFHGADAPGRAVAAARDIQQAIAARAITPGVGIGLYSGPVVAGLIGSGDRFDYTVIGDSVNAAARLCGLAGEGEILADSATATAAGDQTFGPERMVQVKGREGELAVRSLLPAAR